MARLIPKGCSIHRIKVESKGADVGFRCDSREIDEAMMRRGYMSKGSVSQTYPSRFVKGVREVSLGGAHVQGVGAFIGFNLPGPSNCKVQRSGPGKRIFCYTNAQAPSGFDGYRRRSRRRRRN